MNGRRLVRGLVARICSTPSMTFIVALRAIHDGARAIDRAIFCKVESICPCVVALPACLVKTPIRFEVVCQCHALCSDFGRGLP